MQETRRKKKPEAFKGNEKVSLDEIHSNVQDAAMSFLMVIGVHVLDQSCQGMQDESTGS